MTGSAQTVLITGVSSGVGHALAAHYLDRRDRVLGLSRRSPEDLLGRENFRFESLDLREFDQIAAALDRLLNGLDRVDLVVLNAGVLGYFGDVAEAPLENLKETMDVNVWSNKVLLDGLFASGCQSPQVVAISSGAAVNGNRGWAGYSVSKAALNMLVRLYSRERPETHFTALAPGTIDTAMMKELCSRPPDERYPSVDALRSKRNTAETPPPEEAAERLAAAFARLPESVESGEYADVRQWAK